MRGLPHQHVAHAGQRADIDRRRRRTPKDAQGRPVSEVTRRLGQTAGIAGSGRIVAQPAEAITTARGARAREYHIDERVRIKPIERERARVIRMGPDALGARHKAAAVAEVEDQRREVVVKATERGGCAAPTPEHQIRPTIGIQVASGNGGVAMRRKTGLGHHRSAGRPGPLERFVDRAGRR